MDPILLSQNDAALMLSVSLTTIWRLYKAGELATVKIGSRTLITAESCREYVRRHASHSDEA